MENPTDDKKKTRYVGFRLDKETEKALDQLGVNRSAILRGLIQRASIVNPPPQERESAL